MLAHRLRRRPNIKPTLFECLVFAGTKPIYGCQEVIIFEKTVHKLLITVILYIRHV